MNNIFDDIFTDADYDQLNNLVRWNGLNRINNESVAHHSFIVSWFSRILVEEMFPEGEEKLKLDVTTYAIFHDFDEMFSGDITHNVKYNKYNGHKIKEMIDDYCHHMVSTKFKEFSPTNNMLKSYLLGDNDPVVKTIVKLADWLSMLFYVKKEITLGNKDLYKEFDYCVEKIREASGKCFKALKERGKFEEQVLVDISSLNYTKYGR